jgi:hypothetical protein
MAIRSVTRWRVKLAHWLDGRNATNVGAALLTVGLAVPEFIVPGLIAKAVGGAVALVGFLIILSPTIREWLRRRREGEIRALVRKTENRTITIWEDGRQDVEVRLRGEGVITLTGFAIGQVTLPDEDLGQKPDRDVGEDEG